MKLKLLFLLVLIPSFSLLSTSATGDGPSLDAIVAENHTLLNSSPKTFKKQKPNGSVGVILYTYKAHRPYLLIGQERPDKKDGGTFCELGGSMELKGGASETFGEGLVRELKEESAGSYDVDVSYLERHSILVHRTNPTSGREEVYAFVQAPKFVSAEVLLRAVGAATEQAQKEKSAFLWVKADSLQHLKPASVPVSVEDIKGHKYTVDLRSFFYNFLRDPQAQTILKRLIETSC